MTESNIYQIIGKAYCDGMAEGMSKQASFEKQALDPETLVNAAQKAYRSKSVDLFNKFIGTAANRADSAAKLVSPMLESGKFNPHAVRMISDRIDTIQKMVRDAVSDAISGGGKFMHEPVNYNKLPRAAINALLGLKWFNRSLKSINEQFPSA